MFWQKYEFTLVSLGIWTPFDHVLTSSRNDKHPFFKIGWEVLGSGKRPPRPPLVGGSDGFGSWENRGAWYTCPIKKRPLKVRGAFKVPDLRPLL